MKHIIKILILLSFVSCQQNKINKERIIEIGEKLTQKEFTDINSKQISDIVFVGNGLRKKIIELQKNATRFEILIKEGDIKKPFGNNQADAILIIKTDYKNIEIRLKYDNVKDKYHILGWYTLDNL